MNTLKLKLNPYKDINKISLDDKPISSYSELSNFMKEPFLKWADELLTTAERELNDEYDLIVQAEEFEKLFLQDLQNDYDACLNFSTEVYDLDLPIKERYKSIVKLAGKYGVKIKDAITKIKVYQDNPEELQLSDKGSLNDSFLYIVNDENIVNSIHGDNEAKIILVPSDHNEIKTVGPMKFLWKARKETIQTIIDSVIDRFVKVPAIVSLHEALQPFTDQMNEEELEILANTIEIDLRVTVKSIPGLEVGTTYNLELSTVPAGREVPPLTCVSLNPDVVKVDGYTLTALRPGKAEIELYKADENIPFDKKRVETFKNNFVQKIEISVPENHIPVGREVQIIASLFPADADDINSLEWTVSNPEIANISREGKLTALSPGYVSVFVKTKNAEAQGSEIVVVPVAQSIVLPSKSIDCYIMDKVVFPVQIYPENCFDKTFTVECSDSNVAKVEFTPDGVPSVIATGIGSCELVFKSSVKSVYEICKVTVSSKMLEESPSHTWLAIAFGAFLVTLSSSGLFALLGAAATVFCGFTASKNNRGDASWAMLLIGLSIVTALYKLVF